MLVWFLQVRKKRKWNRQNIPAIKVFNGLIITVAIEKANTFNSYYSSVFISENNILDIQGENTGDPFTTDIKTIRRNIKAIGKTNQYDQTESLDKFLNWMEKPWFRTLHDY